MTVKKVYQRQEELFRVILKFVFIVAVIVATIYMDFFVDWVRFVIQFLLGISALMMLAVLVTRIKKGEAYILFEEDGITKVSKWNTVEKAFYTDTFDFIERNGEVKNIIVRDKNNKASILIPNNYEVDLKVIKEEIIRRQKS